MTREQTAIMEKARAKRQRRAAKKAAPSVNPPDTDPIDRIAGKVVDFAVGAAAHVGELVKVATSKLSFVD